MPAFDRGRDMGLRDVSIRWRLLIPFLLLSFAGTTTLVWIAFRSQHALILASERGMLEGHYQRFLQSIHEKGDQAMSLAWFAALDPHVQECFKKRDRQALLDHLTPIYRLLHERFGVQQLHFHTPPATSFLRVHRPNQHGDSMATYRRTIIHTVETRRAVGGLEWGPTGYAIRGVVPIVTEGTFLGTVEVGFSFGEPFVRLFQQRYGCDLTIYVPDVEGGGEALFVLATTLRAPPPIERSHLREFESQTAPTLWMPFREDEGTSGLLGPVRDFSGRVIALVGIRIDRAPILALLSRYRWEMSVVEILGLLAATLVVWVVVQRFLSPVQEMVRGAADIAAGKRLHLPVRGKDEVSRLAGALNNMVGFLEASRRRMEDYAQNLEAEVQKRTKELRLSEEKHRSLMETVPLVVYQMNPDRTLSFVNSFVEVMLGQEPSALMGQAGAFDRLIHPEDRERIHEGFRDALAMGMEWIAEYRMELPQGRIIHVREHAVPVMDEEERGIHVDGILVDLTDQKNLEEKTLQAEELKTLGEIAARLAHEIRNPLTSIGGLSRRILRELPEDHPARSWTQIIVKEVQRLESILQMILSYIQPVDVHLVLGNLAELMERMLQDLVREFGQRGRTLSWEIGPAIPGVLMDRDLLQRALETLTRHTLFHMNEATGIQVRLTLEDEWVRIRWHYESSTLARDDLDHYFFPFLAQGMPDASLLDLPVAKIIIHKHGGLVQVGQGKGKEIVLQVALPVPHADVPVFAPDGR
jgi:PAS domain S-box-containing protein